MGDYKEVPVEPTTAMREVWKRMRGYCWHDKYKAMLAAAPVLQPAPNVSALVEALEELADLMEDTRQGDYTPDSFTTQPARIALDAYRKQEWESGLPPVGVECEIRYLGYYNNNWMPFRATAITNDFVVGYIKSEQETAVKRKDPYVEYRPLKSKQERQREESK